MSFSGIIAAAHAKAEEFVGEVFTYSGVSLRGIFSDGSESWTFDDFCQRNNVDIVCVSGKAQWVTAGKTPENRGVLTYSGKQYVITAIRGERSDDPCYHLALSVRK